tara:strand:- start:990 stop:1406 length:417 start_codon:yes stop_codon:yes gene_type:complete
MLKLLSTIFALVLMTSACGTIDHIEVGIENTSKLILRAEKLQGTQIFINNKLIIDIEKKDFVKNFKKIRRSEPKDDSLDKYRMGVLGVADRDNEGLESITIEVEEGFLSLRVESMGVALLKKELYIAKGQTREVRIKR